MLLSSPGDYTLIFSAVINWGYHRLTLAPGKMCPASTGSASARAWNISLFIICYCFTCLEMVIASALIHGSQCNLVPIVPGLSYSPWARLWEHPCQHLANPSRSPTPAAATCLHEEERWGRLSLLNQGIVVFFYSHFPFFFFFWALLFNIFFFRFHPQQGRDQSSFEGSSGTVLTEQLRILLAI